MREGELLCLPCVQRGPTPASSRLQRKWGKSIRQPEDPFLEAAVAALTQILGVAVCRLGGDPGTQFLHTLPTRLEEETRKREDAEHNLVLFRKVSSVSPSPPLPYPYPTPCLRKNCLLGNRSLVPKQLGTTAPRE